MHKKIILLFVSESKKIHLLFPDSFPQRGSRLSFLIVAVTYSVGQAIGYQSGDFGLTDSPHLDGWFGPRQLKIMMPMPPTINLKD